MMIKRSLILLAIPLLFLISGCATNQEAKIVGVWELTRMDALPGEYPLEQWEFTSDNDIIKYEVTEIERNILSSGRWGISKRNKLNIEKFDIGFNGEWDIVKLDNNVLRIVLRVVINDKDAGQVLKEFSRTN
jgi:hypothetical protein